MNRIEEVIRDVRCRYTECTYRTWRENRLAAAAAEHALRLAEALREISYQREQNGDMMIKTATAALAAWDKFVKGETKR